MSCYRSFKEEERRLLIKMAIILIAYFGLLVGIAFVIAKLMGWL